MKIKEILQGRKMKILKIIKMWGTMKKGFDRKNQITPLLRIFKTKKEKKMTRCRNDGKEKTVEKERI